MDQGRIQRHQLNKCYPVLKDKWKSINNVINIFFLKSRLFLREGSPLLWTSVNHRVPNIGSLWKKLRFPSGQRAKEELRGNWVLLEHSPCKLQQAWNNLAVVWVYFQTWNRRQKEFTYHLDVFMQPIKNLRFPEANLKTVPAYILYPQCQGVLRSLENLVTSCCIDARRNWETLKSKRERNK